MMKNMQAHVEPATVLMFRTETPTIPYHIDSHSIWPIWVSWYKDFTPMEAQINRTIESTDPVNVLGVLGVPS
jgi:hypothetical protein